MLPKRGVCSRCFSREVWCLLVATTLVSGWAWSLLRPPPSPTVASSFLGVAHAITSMAWTGLRRVQGVRERVLFGVLLLSCVVFVVCFQSVLVKFFASPPRFPEIQSIEELDESGLRVEVISLYFRHVFRFRDSPHWDRMDAKVRVSPMQIGDHVDAIKAGDAHGFVAHDRAIAIFRRLIPAKMGLLHVVPVSVRTIIVSYVFWSSSPYRDRFQAFFGSAQETGLMRKWDQSVVLDYLDKYRHLLDDAFDSGPRKFSLEQLEPAFLLLVLGCCASLVLFLGEHLLQRLSRRASRDLKNRIKEVVRRGRSTSVKLTRIT